MNKWMNRIANRTAAKEIKKDKRNFEKKLAQNIKHDSKSFFAYARSKTKSKIQAGTVLSDKGTLLDSDIKTTQKFKEYFSSVFSQPSIYIDGWLYGMRMTSVVCNVPVLSQNDSTYHHSVFTT